MGEILVCTIDVDPGKKGGYIEGREKGRKPWKKSAMIIRSE